MVRTHTVVAGETLSALALRFYGDAELYRLIATASGIADPNVIDVGQRLIMPDFTRYTVVAGDTLSGLAQRFYGDAQLDWLIAGASGIAESAVINAGQRLIIPDITRYTVVAGDTLSALALRFYGDASFYPLIATVNGIPNPNFINVGRVLVIFVGRSDGFGLTDRGPQRERPSPVVLPVSDLRDRLEPRHQRPASRRLPHQRTQISRPVHVPRRQR